MLSLSQAVSKAHSKRDWFNGMVRTGWALPAYKSGIITWDFLK